MLGYRGCSEFNPRLDLKCSWKDGIANAHYVELPACTGVEGLAVFDHLVKVVDPLVTLAFGEVDLDVLLVIDGDLELVCFFHSIRCVNYVRAHIVLQHLVLVLINLPYNWFPIHLRLDDFVLASWLIWTSHVLEKVGCSRVVL